MPIKINPPAKIIYKNTDQPIDISKKDFVQQANKHTPFKKEILGQSNTETDQNLPWNNPMVREDVTRLFNLRLSEPDWLKLKYLSDITKESMQVICLDILIPSIHRRLKKITNK